MLPGNLIARELKWLVGDPHLVVHLHKHNLFPSDDKQKYMLDHLQILMES